MNYRPLSEIETKYFVSQVGLEPTTLCLRGRCSNRLSYWPKKNTALLYQNIWKTGLCLVGAPGGARTHNPLFRRQILYPIELRVRLHQGHYNLFRLKMNNRLTHFSS